MKKIKIIKLVNHPLTDEQKDGLRYFEIVELKDYWRSVLQNTPDNARDIQVKVNGLVKEIKELGIKFILSPAGSPAFNARLSIECEEEGITQIFSHSIREFKETVAPDGTVSKTNVFRHIKYINMPEEFVLAEMAGLERDEQMLYESNVAYRIRMGERGMVPQRGVTGRYEKDADDDMAVYERQVPAEPADLPEEVLALRRKIANGDCMGEDDED
jgi:hypothetical protein